MAYLRFHVIIGMVGFFVLQFFNKPVIAALTGDAFKHRLPSDITSLYEDFNKLPDYAPLLYRYINDNTVLMKVLSEQNIFTHLQNIFFMSEFFDYINNAENERILPERVGEILIKYPHLKSWFPGETYNIFTSKMNEKSVKAESLTRKKFESHLPEDAAELLKELIRLSGGARINGKSHGRDHHHHHHHYPKSYKTLKKTIVGASNFNLPEQNTLAVHLKNIRFIFDLLDHIKELPQDKDTFTDIENLVNKFPRLRKEMDDKITHEEQLKMNENPVKAKRLTKKKFERYIPENAAELFEVLSRLSYGNDAGSVVEGNHGRVHQRYASSYQTLKENIVKATDLNIPEQSTLADHLKNIRFLIDLHDHIKELPQHKDVFEEIMNVINTFPHLKKEMDEKIHHQEQPKGKSIQSASQKKVKPLPVHKALVQLDKDVILSIRDFSEKMMEDSRVKKHEALENHFINACFITALFENIIDNHGKLKVDNKNEVLKLIPQVKKNLEDEAKEIKNFVKKKLTRIMNTPAPKDKANRKKNQSHKSVIVEDLEHLPSDLSKEITKFIEDTLPKIPEDNPIATHFKNTLSLLRIYEDFPSFIDENSTIKQLKAKESSVPEQVEQFIQMINKEVEDFFKSIYRKVESADSAATVPNLSM